MTFHNLTIHSSQSSRVHIEIGGAVQGVGFRPFVYRLATELQLTGWASNSPQGLTIEAEGPIHILEIFLDRIQKENPPHSSIQRMESSYLDTVGYPEFVIRPSRDGGEKTAVLLPDIATCRECLNEVFNPNNRRFLYPFTNCTHCGPRFSIIESLPYDRASTTMKAFKMCPLCQQEYDDPRDRRFHAQPNACPQCGPSMELWDAEGRILTSRHEAILQTADAIRAGKIVAIKGLGGFHLVADARNQDAVRELRIRKHREEKPLAMMFPNLDMAKAICSVSDIEKNLLLSPESPIVLLTRLESTHESIPIASSVAPGNPYLGIMLPYTPLHHILMRELGFPIVATSGNLSDEPICTDEREALRRLAGIADWYLVHNRPIVRHVDDSVVRIVLGREMILRRARGYAPWPIQINDSYPSVLAVGGHLKNTIAINAGPNIFISQHIGDLETEEAYRAFLEVIESFKTMYEVQPRSMACDLHPDYLSTQYASQSGLPVTRVQHHHAHVVSCMAEHNLEGPVLGVSWDGTGYGTDGMIWGGEFLLSTLGEFERVAHFLPFPLPSGDKAVKEPRRTALGLLYGIYGDKAFELTHLPSVQSFSDSERVLLKSMLKNRINTPFTSSVGRLFDGVASLIGLRQRVSFEGQAAMELEFVQGDIESEVSYPFALLPLPDDSTSAKLSSDGDEHNPKILHLGIDWRPTITAILEEMECKRPIAQISAGFHATLSKIIVETAKHVGEHTVILTGGCFQNKRLIERAVRELKREGFTPYWHRCVPPNDGGISLGQLVAAVHRRK